LRATSARRDSSSALLLGAHLSIAGGLYRVIERARELRCTAVQFFTHSTMQWRMRPLQPTEIDAFARMLRAPGRGGGVAAARTADGAGGRAPGGAGGRARAAAAGGRSRGAADCVPLALVVHAGYLPNLASPDRTLRERSIAVMIEELERCEALAVRDLVLHPGAHMGAGQAWGLRRITGALRRILRSTSGFRARLVIENTAGSGTLLGHDIGQLGQILHALPDAARVRICIDTAHAFAAGYDLTTRDGYEALFTEVDREVGLQRLSVLHLNDSQRECGARVDRHAHIGRGHIGREPFGWIMRDSRLRAVPKIIETPKQGGMDSKNLALLRRLTRGG